MNKREQALREWNNLKSKLERLITNRNLIRDGKDLFKDFFIEKKTTCQRVLAGNDWTGQENQKLLWIRDLNTSQAIIELSGIG